jgi:exo-beta-1,3-glucanase (GH17 family)
MVGILATTLLLQLVPAWQLGQPVPMDDARVATLPCVSYAPFRRPNSTPFALTGSVTAEQIEEDLLLLKPLTDCIRTYGVAQGLDAVPMVARKLGMRVRLGAWLGKDETANRAEIERAIAIANNHRDVVDVLIVGNEVLLRRDLSADQLAGHLRHAKAQTPIAITYADVWEFWQRHAQLQTDVDWVTVHILPYWEDVPVAATDAADHVFKIAHDMQTLFSGKPVWVGETGWPAAGRQRAGARPGVLEQTLLIRQLASRAAVEAVPINIIEAFDQPWKRALEGAMGGAWGLFEADGTRKVNLTGSVMAGRDGWRVAVGAGAGFLAGALAWWVGAATAKIRRRELPPIDGMFTTSLGVSVIGAAIAMQWAFVLLWSRTPREWTIALAVAAAVIAATMVLLLALAGKSGAPKQRANGALLAIAWARLVLMFIAASWALILIADPRYRGFPIALFTAPAALSICFALMPTTGPSSQPYLLHESQFLAWSLLLAAAAMMIQEGLANGQALALACCWVALAAPTVLNTVPRSRESDTRQQ